MAVIDTMASMKAVRAFQVFRMFKTGKILFLAKGLCSSDNYLMIFKIGAINNARNAVISFNRFNII